MLTVFFLNCQTETILVAWTTLKPERPDWKRGLLGLGGTEEVTVVSVVFQEEDLWVNEAAGAEEAAAALCWTESMCCSASSSSLNGES